MPRHPAFSVPDHELEFRATRAGGPGGQHVNTSSTRVELRWNVRTSGALTDQERSRVEAKLANRLDDEGWLRVVAADSRSQHQNRQTARERLEALVGRALLVPNVRRPTRTPPAEKRKRLAEKRRRGEQKVRRRPPTPDE